MVVVTTDRPTAEIKSSVNDFLAEIGKGLKESLKYTRPTFTDWLYQKYYIDDKPISFEGRYPLLEIAEDTSGNMSVMKSAQCGLSELMVGKAIYFAEEYKENVFYAFPAKDQVKDFVQSRVDPRIDDSPELQKLVISTDNTGLKKVGLNYLYFRGSQNARQIKSVSAGFLVRDEYDEMIQEHIPMMDKRLGNSKYKFIVNISTPSYFEFGIHWEYLQTDQKEYHLKCNKCSKWQIPDWTVNIKPAPTRDKEVPIPEKVQLVCSDCGTELNRNQKGKWVAMNPDGINRGYRVSKLMFPITDLMDMWKEYQRTRNIQDFYNSNLGLPYASAGGKLDDQMLNSCMEKYTIAVPKNCTMGVDVGEVLNVKISMKDGDKTKAVYINTVKTFEELDTLMKQYDVSRCVIDGLPETHESKKFAKRFQGRVYLAYYQLKDPNKTYEFKEPKQGTQETAKVNINRNRAMDETGLRFKERENIIPENANTIPNYFDQLKAPQKVKITDENGNEQYKYVEGNKADHYFHAEVYEYIAGAEIVSYKIFTV